MVTTVEYPPPFVWFVVSGGCHGVAAFRVGGHDALHHGQSQGQQLEQRQHRGVGSASFTRQIETGC